MSSVRVASVPTPWEAINVPRCFPSPKSAVKPPIVSVPFPLLVSVRPAGHRPFVVMTGVGGPGGVEGELPSASGGNWTPLLEEIVGAWPVLTSVIVVADDDTAL